MVFFPSANTFIPMSSNCFEDAFGEGLEQSNNDSFREWSHSLTDPLHTDLDPSPSMFLFEDLHQIQEKKRKNSHLEENEENLTKKQRTEQISLPPSSSLNEIPKPIEHLSAPCLAPQYTSPQLSPIFLGWVPAPPFFPVLPFSAIPSLPLPSPNLGHPVSVPNPPSPSLIAGNEGPKPIVVPNQGKNKPLKKNKPEPSKLPDYSKSDTDSEREIRIKRERKKVSAQRYRERKALHLHNLKEKSIHFDRFVQDIVDFGSTYRRIYHYTSLPDLPTKSSIQERMIQILHCTEILLTENRVLNLHVLHPFNAFNPPLRSLPVPSAQAKETIIKIEEVKSNSLKKDGSDKQKLSSSKKRPIRLSQEELRKESNRLAAAKYRAKKANLTKVFEEKSEAFDQLISEIVKRIHQFRLLNPDTAVPPFPEEPSTRIQAVRVFITIKKMMDENLELVKRFHFGK